MLGNAGKTPMIENEHFVPLDAYGLAVLSIGHLTGDHNTPVAWRGKSHGCPDATVQPNLILIWISWSLICRQERVIFN